MSDQSVADAVRGNWVDRVAPRWFRPYARLCRLDRPIGWWLLLWPCWWSAALAAVAAGRVGPNLWHLALFFIGSVAMRGAGCTYNDIVDRDLDASVARTRSRPIPSGQVSAKQAAAFLVLQALVGLAVLLQFNTATILWGLGSLAVVAAYPFMKRFFDMPQLVLGLAFSWGALLGWTAVFGHLDAAPVALYLAAVVWTIGYDTIYALQDKEDDEVIGIHSSARLFGDHARFWIGVLYLATVLLIGAAMVLADCGPLAFVGLALFAAHLVWQVATVSLTDGDRALKLFRSNQYAGALVFLGLVADAAVQALF